MLKNIFYISLAIAIADIIAFFYFTSRSYQLSHTQWFAGFSETITTLGILGVLLLWWIVYFILTKDFAGIWVSLILLLIVGGYFVNYQLQTSAQKNQEKTDKLAWLAKAENKEYVSDKLGISFKYISESEFGGKVSIREDGDVITVTSEKGQYDGGALKVFTKDAKTSLFDYLQIKYGKLYPNCRFSQFVTDNLNGWTPHFPENYSIVVMYRKISEDDCPKIGVEVEHQTSIQNYFILDNNHPAKYIFLSLPDYPIEAYKPKSEQDFPPKWFETIVFK